VLKSASQIVPVLEKETVSVEKWFEPVLVEFEPVVMKRFEPVMMMKRFEPGRV
jgi:hypothetical protein